VERENKRGYRGNKNPDVIIVGGGVMGSSTAYHLTKNDPSYTSASSALSATNIRIQFSLTKNIVTSRYTLEILKIFEDGMAVNGNTSIFVLLEGMLKRLEKGLEKSY
jgi:hypothetical protein